ncbi:hypothetical protein CMUS01_07853 [Colletotrichum musicola]|uniref:Uncharacterized protein n=1 Tax=Colletotrichum musicola TaxID=2175873 RepID=A0A8H6KEU8_9PEZI|nr:hypothetical protein CMUS01_07853 [Colletotrichum musicola]
MPAMPLPIMREAVAGEDGSPRSNSANRTYCAYELTTTLQEVAYLLLVVSGEVGWLADRRRQQESREVGALGARGFAVVTARTLSEDVGGEHLVSRLSSRQTMLEEHQPLTLLSMTMSGKLGTELDALIGCEARGSSAPKTVGGSSPWCGTAGDGAYLGGGVAAVPTAVLLLLQQRQRARRWACRR